MRVGGAGRQCRGRSGSAGSLKGGQERASYNALRSLRGPGWTPGKALAVWGARREMWRGRAAAGRRAGEGQPSLRDPFIV